MWFQVIFIWRETWTYLHYPVFFRDQYCKKYPPFSNFKSVLFWRIDRIYREPYEHVFLVKNLILKIFSLMVLHERLIFAFMQTQLKIDLIHVRYPVLAIPCMDDFIELYQYIEILRYKFYSPQNFQPSNCKRTFKFDLNLKGMFAKN